MIRVIDSGKHMKQKAKKGGVEPLRPNKQMGDIISDITDRPFSILSEKEKRKVLQFCVDEAFRFYTNNNGDL